MTRLLSWLVGITVAIGLLVVQAPPASACSIAPSFVVTAEHLAAGDFNQPTSQLAADYREWTGDDAASIEVLGVYVYETIAAVEAEGDYSRGSVSVPVEIWGQWPSTTAPRAIAPQDQSGEPPTNCGWDPAGQPLGTRSYSIVSTNSTANFVDIKISDDAQAVLVAAFGTPAIAERDLDLEQELIAQIQRPDNSSTPIFVGIGVAALVVAAGVMYAARRNHDIPTPPTA